MARERQGHIGGGQRLPLRLFRNVGAEEFQIIVVPLDARPVAVFVLGRLRGPRFGGHRALNPFEALARFVLADQQFRPVSKIESFQFHRFCDQTTGEVGQDGRVKFAFGDPERLWGRDFGEILDKPLRIQVAGQQPLRLCGILEDGGQGPCHRLRIDGGSAVGELAGVVTGDFGGEIPGQGLRLTLGLVTVQRFRGFVQGSGRRIHGLVETGLLQHRLGKRRDEELCPQFGAAGHRIRSRLKMVSGPSREDASNARK